MELPNALLGPYRLLELLGEGGMGRVWKAVDVRLERVVALKLLKGDDEDRRRALVAEAKTACQLQHPNIAVVFEAGEAEGLSYIAMEYVEGQNLAMALGKPMGTAALLNLAIQACKALNHAHAKGVVHRDIKPDNLVLQTDGTLKVLDFGVAKRNPLPEAGSTAQAFTITRETEAGISVGTPSYMSPEQVFGLSQGSTADQFSLGTVLFELAAGSHPFRKGTLVETLHAIAKDEAPSLGEFRPDLPKALARTLERMLSKEPEKRFPSLQDVQAALEPLALEVASGRLPTAVGRPRRLNRRWLLHGLVAAALITLLAGTFFLARGRGREEAVASSLGRGRKVVAVLPVELEGVSPELAWVGRGFQDAMGMGLVRRGDALVLDRMRVDEAIASVGGQRFQDLRKALGTDFLIVSTLRASGHALRLSIRVLKGEAGEVVEQFQLEGDARNLLAMEDELGRRLPLNLTPGQGYRAVPPVPKARLARTWELYTKGMDLVVQGNVEGYDLGRRLFEEAIQSEPDYAPARAGLSWALLGMSAAKWHLGGADAAKLGERALEEGRKAVALDGGLAMAHRVLAEALHRRGDVSAARGEARRAVELDPADFRALVALGDAFAYQDTVSERAEARLHYQRALELQPTSWFAHYRLAVLLQNNGDLEEALRHADEARKLQPQADYPHLTTAVCLLWLGRDGETAERIEEGLRINPEARLLQMVQLLLLHRTGDRAGFERTFARLEGRWGDALVVQALMLGLKEDLDGQMTQARERFLAFLNTWMEGKPELKTFSERRSVSVNLYHMASVMARHREVGAARRLLEEAERLHPGKRQVARRDPAMKGVLE